MHNKILCVIIFPSEYLFFTWSVSKFRPSESISLAMRISYRTINNVVIKWFKFVIIFFWYRVKVTIWIADVVSLWNGLSVCSTRILVNVRRGHSYSEWSIAQIGNSINKEQCTGHAKPWRKLERLKDSMVENVKGKRKFRKQRRGLDNTIKIMLGT